MDDGDMVTIQVVCCATSTITCFFTAIILFIFKRKSKIHYRLEIGLCIAFGLTNLCAVAMLFTAGHTPHKEHNARGIIEAIAHYGSVFTLPATIHYLLFMYLIFLLKSLGISEEAMSGKEKWMHFLAWSIGVPYIFIFMYVDNIQHFNAIILLVFCLQVGFILACTLLIIIKHCFQFNKNSEVFSPLVSTRTKTTLHSFMVRLGFMTVLTMLVYLQALFFSGDSIFFTPGLGPAYQDLSALFSLDGLLISVLLASTPELIKEYKKRYQHWGINETMPPASPYLADGVLSASSTPSPPLKKQLATKEVSISL